MISDFVKLSGRRGYAGKEVLKSNLSTAIFHEESVVCTLEIERKFLNDNNLLDDGININL